MWQYNYGTTYEISDELMHYGRLGMKWGQHIYGRQAAKALRSIRSADKIAESKHASYDKKYKAKQKHNRAHDKLTSVRTKAQKKLDVLDRSTAKLNKKMNKQIEKNIPKAAKMEQKAAKLKAKTHGRFTGEEKAAEYNAKAIKLSDKAKSIKAKTEAIQAKLDRDEHFRQQYKTIIDNIDQALVKEGRDYIYAEE